MLHHFRRGLLPRRKTLVKRAGISLFDGFWVSTGGVLRDFSPLHQGRFGPSSNASEIKIMKLKLTCIIVLGLSLGALNAQTAGQDSQRDNPTLGDTNSSPPNGANGQIEEPSGAETVPGGRAYSETNPPPGRPFSTNPPSGRPFEDGNVPPGRPFEEGAGAQPGSTNEPPQDSGQDNDQNQPGQPESQPEQGTTPSQP